MMSPQMDKWQMALANSYQVRGILAGSIDVPYASHESAQFKGIGMCCLGVCLHANGAKIEHLTGLGMPQLYHKRWGNEELMPVDETIQRYLSNLNDKGLSHRIIRELLIDFALTGDPTEISKLSNNYISFNRMYGK